MLPKIDTPIQKLEKYRQFLTEKQFEEILNLAVPLKGLTINLVNSTPRGGGVAEILKSLVPLLSDYLKLFNKIIIDFTQNKQEEKNESVKAIFASH